MIAATLTIYNSYATLISGTLIPLVTGLLTHLALSSRVKELITILLNAIAALLTSLIANGTDAVITGATLTQFVIGLAFSYGAYYGIFKKAGLTSSSPVGKLLPTKGIGTDAG